MSQLFIANWKSHFSQAEAMAWLDELAQSWQPNSEAKMIVTPPLSLVGAVDWFARQDSHLSAEQQAAFELAVQDLSPFPAGAYTGAVCAANLAGFAVKYAILGHSERRRYFHENHAEVANKVQQALDAHITPIVCVDAEYVMAQAAALPKEQLAQCVVAYEPLEAIGTGSNQPVAEVKPVVEHIRQVWGAVPVVYGGSVSDENAAEYLSEVDGLLVGTKSLKVSEWLKIIQ